MERERRYDSGAGLSAGAGGNSGDSGDAWSAVTRSEPPEPSRRTDLTGLTIAGLTRRRAAWLLAAFVTIWIVSVFARQIGEAGSAADRAAQIRAGNVQLAGEVATLQAERDLVQRQSYIEQAARAFGLGGRNERPFTLAENAPALAADAPGSAAVRLGARAATVTPLDRWLDLLFGAHP